MYTAHQPLWDLGLQTVKDLETESGILASGKSELYGCIFGRDSLITCLKLLQVYKRTQQEDCLRIVKKSLVTLASLQGKEVNIESGEEPGKMIHEYRPDNHSHLTKELQNPWYVYPDDIMRNYDTVDATPLFLICLYRYWQISNDDEILTQLLPNITAALSWITELADGDKDGFVDYALKNERVHGGLINQNWMDSVESTFHEDGRKVVYPLAPAEAQAYTYLALRLWSRYFRNNDRGVADRLDQSASHLKNQFNQRYVIVEKKRTFIAPAIDGAGQPLLSIRSSMGHCLWASLTKANDGEFDCIINTRYIPGVVKQLLAPDLFEPAAGIRTLSTQSRNFTPNSYHNGSIWPHDTSMVAEGLDNAGYHQEAYRIRRALLSGIRHFNTPIELFVYWNGQYSEFVSLSGQRGCKQQAWSAASVLADTLAVSAHQKKIENSLYLAPILLMLLNSEPTRTMNSIIKTSLRMFTNTIPVKQAKLATVFKILLPKELSNNS